MNEAQLAAHAKYKEAVARACMYPQAYPGDGFTHELETKGPGGPELHQVKGIQLPQASIQCPCESNIFLERPYRWNGEVDILICHSCHFWHAITWRVSQPKDKRSGGKFLVGRKPPQA